VNLEYGLLRITHPREGLIKDIDNSGL
jgi:hypothetical protein